MGRAVREGRAWVVQPSQGPAADRGMLRPWGLRRPFHDAWPEGAPSASDAMAHRHIHDKVEIFATMVDAQSGVERPTGGTLLLAAALAVAFLFLIIGRLIGLIDASGNDNIDGAVKASWWLMEIGLWIATVGLAGAGLLTRSFSAGARAAMVLVAVFLLATPNSATSMANVFSGFGF